MGLEVVVGGGTTFNWVRRLSHSVGLQRGLGFYLLPWLSLPLPGEPLVTGSFHIGLVFWVCAKRLVAASSLGHMARVGAV